MSTSRSGSDLESLYTLYRELAAHTDPASRQTLIETVLLHPVSRRKLSTACGVVLRKLAGRADLRADLQQEARLHVARNLWEQRLSYTDQGPEKFGGWLWMMWLFACKSAWYRCQPLWLKGITIDEEEEVLESIPERTTPPAPVTELLVELLASRGHEPLRQALLDWLGGLTVRESAARHNLSRSAVSRLRQKLIEQLKAVRRD